MLYLGKRIKLIQDFYNFEKGQKGTIVIFAEELPYPIEVEFDKPIFLSGIPTKNMPINIGELNACFKEIK